MSLAPGGGGRRAGGGGYSSAHARGQDGPSGGQRRRRRPPPKKAEFEADLYVPEHLPRLIIGRGGENIRRLEGEHGCRLQIAPLRAAHINTEQRMSIKGPFLSVVRTIGRICLIVTNSGWNEPLQCHIRPWQGGTLHIAAVQRAVDAPGLLPSLPEDAAAGATQTPAGGSDAAAAEGAPPPGAPAAAAADNAADAADASPPPPWLLLHAPAGPESPGPLFVAVAHAPATVDADTLEEAARVAVDDVVFAAGLGESDLLDAHQLWDHMVCAWGCDQKHVLAALTNIFPPPPK